MGDVEDDDGDDRFSLTACETSAGVCGERGRDRVIGSSEGELYCRCCRLGIAAIFLIAMGCDWCRLDEAVDDGRAAFRRSSSTAAVSSDRRKAFATLYASRASLCARIKAFWSIVLHKAVLKCSASSSTTNSRRLISAAGTDGGLRTLVCLVIVFTVVGGMVYRS